MPEYGSQEALRPCHGGEPFVRIALQAIEDGGAISRDGATLAGTDLAPGSIDQAQVRIQIELGEVLPSIPVNGISQGVSVWSSRSGARRSKVGQPTTQGFDSSGLAHLSALCY